MAFPSHLRARGGQVASMSQTISGIVGLTAFLLLRAIGDGAAVAVFAIVPLIGLLACVVIRWDLAGFSEKVGFAGAGAPGNKVSQVR